MAGLPRHIRTEDIPFVRQCHIMPNRPGILTWRKGDGHDFLRHNGGRRDRHAGKALPCGHGKSIVAVNKKDAQACVVPGELFNALQCGCRAGKKNLSEPHAVGKRAFPNGGHRVRHKHTVHIAVRPKGE
jgi:hypothetical protein